MVDYRSARRRLGLTQHDLGQLAGVTQPAIAAYEAGHRRPTGKADLVLNGMLDVFDGPVVEDVDDRGRQVELPASRWQPVVSPDAVIKLPTKLDWSPSRDPWRDLSDRRERAWAYAQVLNEGMAADVRFWIDPEILVEMWPDIPTRRSMRPHVQSLVERLESEPVPTGYRSRL